MSEAQTLILAVEKHPSLWNIHDADYHNRDVKDSAWEKVCKEVIKDWKTCSEVIKENKGADLKKKWTHIRDYYRRHFQKNIRTGSAAKKARKYIYADLLSFLIPVFDKINTEGNNESNDFENDSRDPESTAQETNIVEQEYEDIKIEPPSPQQNSSTICLKQEKDEVQTQILGILEVQQNQQKQEEEDDDTKFLLSFRTHMKHMKENQKIDFKLGMLELLKRISTEYCSSSPLNNVKK